MPSTIRIMIASVVAVLLIAAPASASAWIGAVGATQSNGVVTLNNSAGPTSYENPSIDIGIVNGQTISFEYRVTTAGASTLCAGGTPRVFVQGGVYNTHDGLGGEGTCASRTVDLGDGWHRVTGTISGVGLGSTAGHVGLVNDNTSAPRTIEIRNLTIAGVTVFTIGKDGCKGGGWLSGGHRNLGQCVSSVAKVK